MKGAIKMGLTNVELSNDRLILREVKEEDWENFYAYASLSKVTKYQPWEPKTKEDAVNHVKELLQEAAKIPRTHYALAIVLEDVMIGTGELENMDGENKSAELSYTIHPEYWGQNIATETSEILIKFGFEALGLHRIYATCDPNNIASEKVLEKVGMIKEGRLRENYQLEDGWRDSYLYSIIKHEWESL